MIGDHRVTIRVEYRVTAVASWRASMRMIDTWHEGGLDFLWAERRKLGLPTAVTSTWRERRTFISHETGNWVQPANIPARDQVLAYGAQIRASFDQDCRRHIAAVLGAQASVSLARMSRVAGLVWKAYSFISPGGADFDPKRTVAAQSGRRFGSRTAILFLAHRAGVAGASSFDLNDILTVPDVNHIEAVRSAKTRAAEALYLERLLTVVRELLPPTVACE